MFRTARGILWVAAVAWLAPWAVAGPLAAGDAKPAETRPAPPKAGAVVLPAKLQKLFERLDALGRDKVAQARFVEVGFRVSPSHTGQKPPPGHTWTQNSWLLSEDADTITILDIGLVPYTFRKSGDTLIPTSWQPTPVLVDSVKAADFEKACQVLAGKKDPPDELGTPNPERIMVAHAAWKRGLARYCEPKLTNDPSYGPNFEKYEQDVLDQLAWLHFIDGVHLLRFADRREVVRNLKLVKQLSPKVTCAADAEDLVKHLERFIAQPPKASAVADELQLSPADTAEHYVSQLVELDCLQAGQPGRIEFYLRNDAASTIAPTWKLRKLGVAAVPALLKALEDDTPTRTVYHWRDFDERRYVWRVSDFAWYVLRDIARQDFGGRDDLYSRTLNMMPPEKKQHAIDDIKKWHSANPAGAPATGGWGVLLLTAICGSLALGMAVLLIRRRRGNKAAGTVAPETPHRPWSTIRLATILVLLTIFVGLTAYTGTYYFLSRRGLEETPMDSPAWIYVPYDELLRGSPTSLHRHDWYECIFRPLNWLDHKLFGTPRAANRQKW